MVAPLVIAAAGLSAVGKILGGASARSSARARAKANEMQARQALLESGVAAQVGVEADEREIARAATLAAAGGGGFEGSAMRVLDDLSRQSVFRARSSIYRGQAEAQARRYDAKVAKREGDNALFSSIVGAGSSLLSSFASSRLGAGGGGGPSSILAGKTAEVRF